MISRWRAKSGAHRDGGLVRFHHAQQHEGEQGTEQASQHFHEQRIPRSVGQREVEREVAVDQFLHFAAHGGGLHAVECGFERRRDRPRRLRRVAPPVPRGRRGLRRCARRPLRCRAGTRALRPALFTRNPSVIKRLMASRTEACATPNSRAHAPSTTRCPRLSRPCTMASLSCPARCSLTSDPVSGADGI